MATVQAELFLDRVAADAEFADRLASHADDPHMVFAIVVDMGFDATPEEIREAFLERNMRELTEPQLAAIAGGLSESVITPSVFESGLTVTATAGVAAAAV